MFRAWELRVLPPSQKDQGSLEAEVRMPDVEVRQGLHILARSGGLQKPGPGRAAEEASSNLPVHQMPRRILGRGSSLMRCQNITRDD